MKSIKKHKEELKIIKKFVKDLKKDSEKLKKLMKSVDIWDKQGELTEHYK